MSPKVRLHIFRGIPRKKGIGPWILTKKFKRIKYQSEWEELLAHLTQDVFEYKEFSPELPCVVFYDEDLYVQNSNVLNKYASVFYSDDFLPLHRELLKLDKTLEDSNFNGKEHFGTKE